MKYAQRQSGGPRLAGRELGQWAYGSGPADNAERTDRVFHALADPTRRDIVQRTLEGEQSVSSLARRYPMSFAAVQKHVAVLERAALVTKERRGREQLVRGRVETIRSAAQLLEQLEVVWQGRIERIEQILSEDRKGAHT